MGLKEIDMRSNDSQTFLKIAFLCFIIAWIALPSSCHAGDVIKVGGTGSGLGVMKLLGEAYIKKNPQTRVQVMPNLGSSGGIRGVVKGILDVGISARPLRDDEKNYKLSLTEYARTPFVVVVRQDTAISDLRMEDLVGIYNGSIQAWPDGRRVRPVLRPAEDIVTQLAKEMSPDMAKAVDTVMSRRGMIIAVTDQDATTTIENTPGAVGFSTLGQMITEKPRLKVLSLNGVYPTIMTLSNGSYKYNKRLILVARREQSAQVRNFLGFIASPEGRKILEESGYDVTLKKMRW